MLWVLGFLKKLTIQCITMDIYKWYLKMAPLAGMNQDGDQ